MAPSSIFFNGRLISVPGSYSEVDASGLEPIGLGAAGIIGLLGTAVGGRPVTAVTKLDDLIKVNKPEQGRRTFKEGDLREAIPFLFNPARDPAVPGGAVQVVAMKVNPATQSAVTLANSQGDAIEITSADWGAFTEQVNIDVQDGTTQGKLLTITFEDEVETVDNLGGDDIFTLTFVPLDTPTAVRVEYDTVTLEVLSTGALRSYGSFGTTGADTDLASLLANGAIRIVSTNNADRNTVIIYGLDASDNPVSETLQLNGTTDVDGTQVFKAASVLGWRIVGTSLGTVTLSDQVTPTTIDTLTAGTNQTGGLRLGYGLWVDDSFRVNASLGTTDTMIVVGKSLTGATQLEAITLNGSTIIPTTLSWSKIDYLAVGEVPVASTIIFDVTAVQTDPAVHNTIQKVADYFNARQVSQTTVRGYDFSIVIGDLTFDPTNLDVSTSQVDVTDPANPGFKADLYAMVAWINANSDLVTAAVASGATGGAVTNTTAPVFLAGGTEGTATSTEYQSALDWLKRLRVNTIVPLTHDPAIHALVEAHCAYMGGVGRSERDAVVGLQNAGLTDVPTKAEAKSQIVDLNSRHVRAVAQAMERFGTDGARQEFAPKFLACVIAGMQAGSDVGEPLTYKITNTLAFRQDSSWNPTDDAEEMVQAGLLFLENVDGVGRRVVRNITTFRNSANLAFVEGSVNEAVNFAVFNFRTNLEFAVGQKGFSGTVNAAKSVALNTLGLLVDAQVLVAYRSLTAELIVDVMEVEAEIAPVLPINFIKNTLHLVTIRQTAA